MARHAPISRPRPQYIISRGYNHNMAACGEELALESEIGIGTSGSIADDPKASSSEVAVMGSFGANLAVPIEAAVGETSGNLIYIDSDSSYDEFSR